MSHMTNIDYTRSPLITSPSVAQAFSMANAAHAGQVRLGTSLPYIVHPIAVAFSVAVYGDENMIKAALLHDVVEDTPITLKQITRAFGEDTAFLVSAMTKDPNLTKMENVQRTVSLGLRPTLLKEADTGNNMSDLDPGSSLMVFYEKSMAVIQTAKFIYLAHEAA